MKSLLPFFVLFLAGCFEPVQVSVPPPPEPNEEVKTEVSYAPVIIEMNPTYRAILGNIFPNAKVLAEFSPAYREFIFDLNGTDGDPFVIPKWWNYGKTKLRNDGCEHCVEVADAADSGLPGAIIFRFRKTDAYNSLGEPFFLVNGLRAHAATVYYGGFDRLIVVEILADDPKHLAFEVGHAAWWWSRSADRCADDSSKRVASWIWEGGPCDPMRHGFSFE